jgi:hypothetical protein
MKILLALLLTLPAAAQTTVTIPAPDGTTITSKGNVWSCVQSGGLPSGVTFANGLLTAPAISTAKLTLTGGVNYAAGLYLTSIDASGNITYSPYVAPAGGTAAPSTAYTVTLPANASVGSELTTSVTLKIPGVTPTANTVTANPQVWAAGGNFDFIAWISAPGVVTVQVRNKTWAPLNFPATVFTVKVQ